MMISSILKSMKPDKEYRKNKIETQAHHIKISN